MICEKILGKLTDGEFSGKKVDYVDIHWMKHSKNFTEKQVREAQNSASAWMTLC